MFRAVSDIQEGEVVRWNMPGLRAYGDGYALGDQLFCVQNGFAGQRLLSNSVRLMATCFGSDPARLSDELACGGLAWDFLVALHRGHDPDDVVAACLLVYGRTNTPSFRRQYFYVFNVCTHPTMGRRGLAKVIMDAVYRLGCLVLRERQGLFWGRVLDFSERLWLLAEVDLQQSKGPVSPEKLVQLYTAGSGYSPLDPSNTSVPITPLESCVKRWRWFIQVDSAVKRQLWLEVRLENEGTHTRVVSQRVLDELRGISSAVAMVASRFELLLDGGGGYE